MSPRGGKRSGAGRKPIPEEQKKDKYVVHVPANEEERKLISLLTPQERLVILVEAAREKQAKEPDEQKEEHNG